MRGMMAVLGLVLALLAAGSPARAAGLSSAKRAAIETLIRNFMKAHRTPGASFAIGLDGRLVWSQGFGLADIENGTAATPETAYRTASIGKSMAAIAAMELVEQGRLDLDRPIQAYCPRFPAKPWPITTRTLLSHTSGIRDPNEPAELYNDRHYQHASDALDIFKDDPLKLKPGADMLYTTWGYVTLGCVLEGAAGEELRPLMRRLVFDASGMTATRDDDPSAIIAHRARGYRLEGGTLQNSHPTDMSFKLAAGGWITTAPDLIGFLDAVMDNRLVRPETLAVMLTPYVLPDHGGTVDGYGMGWFLDDYHGHRAGYHGGGTPQVSAIAFMVPDTRIAVAGAFNLEGLPGRDRLELAEAIADVVLGYKEPVRKHLVD